MNEKMKAMGLKVGDTVSVTKDILSGSTGRVLVKKGDVGVIIPCPDYWVNPEQDIAANFSGQEGQDFVKDGCWCVYQEDMAETECYI